MYRHFPFIGDESWRAAEAAECAAEQDRFQEYSETVYYNWNGENQLAYSDANLREIAGMTGLFLNQYDECMFTGKYLEKVTADFEAGVAAGVNSTPTIFLNGKIIGGLKDFGDYRVKIEQALAEVGG